MSASSNSPSPRWGPGRWVESCVGRKCAVKGGYDGSSASLASASDGTSPLINANEAFKGGLQLVATHRLIPSDVVVSEESAFLVPPVNINMSGSEDQTPSTDAIEALVRLSTLSTFTLLAESERKELLESLCRPPDSDAGVQRHVDLLAKDVTRFISQLSAEDAELGAKWEHKQEELIDVLLALECNSHAIARVGFGCRAVFPTICKTNHSCCANCMFQSRVVKAVESPTGYKVIGELVALKTVEPGEELTINYLPPHMDCAATYVRKNFLRTTKYFDCACPRCSDSDNSAVFPANVESTFWNLSLRRSPKQHRPQESEEEEMQQRAILEALVLKNAESSDGLKDRQRYRVTVELCWNRLGPSHWTTFRTLMDGLEGLEAGEVLHHCREESCALGNWGKQRWGQGLAADPAAAGADVPAGPPVFWADALCIVSYWSVVNQMPFVATTSAVFGVVSGVCEAVEAFVAEEHAETPSSVADPLRGSIKIALGFAALHLLHSVGVLGVANASTTALKKVWARLRSVSSNRSFDSLRHDSPILADTPSDDGTAKNKGKDDKKKTGMATLDGAEDFFSGDWLSIVGELQREVLAFLDLVTSDHFLGSAAHPARRLFKDTIVQMALTALGPLSGLTQQLKQQQTLNEKAFLAGTLAALQCMDCLVAVNDDVVNADAAGEKEKEQLSTVDSLLQLRLVAAKEMHQLSNAAIALVDVHRSNPALSASLFPTSGGESTGATASSPEVSPKTTAAVVESSRMVRLTLDDLEVSACALKLQVHNASAVQDFLQLPAAKVQKQATLIVKQRILDAVNPTLKARLKQLLR